MSFDLYALHRHFTSVALCGSMTPSTNIPLGLSVQAMILVIHCLLEPWPWVTYVWELFTETRTVTSGYSVVLGLFGSIEYIGERVALSKCKDGL